MTTTVELVERDAAVPAAEALRTLQEVLDPELGVDVVNLGLVYAVTVEGAAVCVRMTLTTPGCPLHTSIEEQVRGALSRLPGVDHAAVELVWDPPWTPMAMTAEGKRQLGFL
ncbi:MAG TPA: metal-sulfur cluster assembly factor [Trueperaceae bacterium]|nr:metal-sulfur cluster assembly factor [Trueperaceae bacterium]